MSERDPKEVARLARELTNKLAGEGKIIAGGWAGYRMLMDPRAGPTQIEETRMAFYAGAQHLFTSIMCFISDDPDHEPTDEDMRRMSLVADELQAFLADYKRKHGIP